MKIIHIMCNCVNCKATLEIFSEDIDCWKVTCPECGHTYEVDDYRLKAWQEEY